MNNSYRFSCAAIAMFFVLFMQSITFAQNEPRLHLITFCDESNAVLTNYSNADIAKISSLFLENIPSQRVTITHLLCPGKTDSLFNPAFIDEPSPYDISDMEGRICKCKYFVRYIVGNNDRWFCVKNKEAVA